MSKRLLRKEIFFNARKFLPNQSEEVYGLFHFIGEELPEKFDPEDLAEVINNIINTMILYPERLPQQWMVNNPIKVAKFLGKVPELLSASGAGSQYNQPFKIAFEKLMRAKKRMAM